MAEEKLYEIFRRNFLDLKNGVKKADENIELFQDQVKKQAYLKAEYLKELQKLRSQNPGWYKDLEKEND